MQTGLDAPWWEEDDPETIEMRVGIEGVGSDTYEVPVSLLEQEFDDDESRREFIESQLNSMAFALSIAWRDQR